MLLRLIRYRFQLRLRAPLGPDEVRRTERWLATARVFLTISAFVAIWMDPNVIHYSPWAYLLLTFYFIHGVMVMLLLRFRRESTLAFRLLVHSVDVLWPALISLFAAGQSNPFFLFFIFVLTAAAYRWGLWETAATACSAIALLYIQSFLLSTGLIPWINGHLTTYRLLELGVDIRELEPKALFMRSVYLLVMALLLGYMAEQQKQLRSEKAIIARIIGGARVEAGLSGTIEWILGQMLSLYGARRALIASQEAYSYRVFLGEVRAAAEGPSHVKWLESTAADQGTYLYPSDADVAYVTQSNSSLKWLALDQNGARVRDFSPQVLTQLREGCDFRSLLTVTFVFGQEWTGRIFFFDPFLAGEREEELRFLQEIVRQVGPAVYNVYLMRRLRLRAGAVERARFARELHDGAIQSLIGVEMQVDVLRRKATSPNGHVSEELGRIQGLLREEVLNLRELMQQMKSLEVDGKRLVPFIGDTVERFQRETGIPAKLITDLTEVDFSARVCRELARIVQESLVNIRKHSGAGHVLVHLAQKDGRLHLQVEDDGRGFPFTGRVAHAEREEVGKGPLVIKERVRLIDGELTIESNPGQGSRLEISLHHKPEPALR